MMGNTDFLRHLNTAVKPPTYAQLQAQVAELTALTDEQRLFIAVMKRRVDEQDERIHEP